jgi:hypothetical protein
VRMRCPECGASWPTAHPSPVCPVCSSSDPNAGGSPSGPEAENEQLLDQDP